MIGFVMAIAIAASIAVMLSIAFAGFEMPSNFGQAGLWALVATAFVLMIAGGEIAATFLLSKEAQIGEKLTRFLGAICAIVVAFLVTPLALSWLNDAEETECETTTQFNIGPIAITREVCQPMD